MRAHLAIAVCALAACTKDPTSGRVQSNTALTADTHSFFPIGNDAKHAGTDCNACHGDFSSFKQFSCTSGCHEKASTDSGHPGLPDYKYESTACLSCHPGGTADGSFATHPFPIGAITVHAGIDCKTCHIVAGDYTQFSCTNGCHTQTTTDAIHPGVSDYAYTSPKCLSCHPQGIAVGGANHTQFPISAGTSHALGCSQCHKSATMRSDVSTLECASCHALRSVNTKHAKVAGFVASSPKCIACHADDQVDKVATHTQFPIAFGKDTHDTLCLECHNTNRTDKTYGANFTKSDCLTCHAQHSNVTQAALQPGHQTVPNYTYTSDACIGCHPTGTGIAPANHDVSFPIGTASKHTGIACTECHTNLAQPKVATNFKCATCHTKIDTALVTKHTANTNSNIHVKANELSATDSRTCLRCHADVKANPPTNDSLVFRTTSHKKGSPCADAGSPPHHNAGCTDCHSGYRADKTYAAAFDGPAAVNGTLTPPGCAQCHQNRQVCP